MANQLLTVTVCTLLLLPVLAAAQAQAPSPAYWPSSTESCSGELGSCLFSFEGTTDHAPVFDLGRGVGDQPLSQLAVVANNGQAVLTVNTNGGYTFTGPPMPSDNQRQFYGQGRFLYVRSFNYPQQVADYRGRCYRVNLTSVQLGGGVNLNPNDGNAQYPEAGRCVIFATRGVSPGEPSGKCPSVEAVQELNELTVSEYSRILAEAGSQDVNVTFDTKLEPLLESLTRNGSELLAACPNSTLTSRVFEQTMQEICRLEQLLLSADLSDTDSDDSENPGRRKLLGLRSWTRRQRRRARNALKTAKRIAEGVWDCVEDNRVGQCLAKSVCTVSCLGLGSAVSVGCFVADGTVFQVSDCPDGELTKHCDPCIDVMAKTWDRCPGVCGFD